MLRILQPHELAGIPVIATSAARTQDSCTHCGAGASSTEAFRPDPQAGGNLQVDPDILLPSPGMDVHIAQYYNSGSNYNGPVGYGRTMSPLCFAQASGSPLLVTMTRGNGVAVTYQSTGGTGGPFTSFTPNNFNTISYRSGNLLETTPQGLTGVYPENTTGQRTSLSYCSATIIFEVGDNYNCR